MEELEREQQQAAVMEHGEVRNDSGQGNGARKEDELEMVTTVTKMQGGPDSHAVCNHVRVCGCADVVSTKPRQI